MDQDGYVYCYEVPYLTFDAIIAVDGPVVPRALGKFLANARGRVNACIGVRCTDGRDCTNTDTCVPANNQGLIGAEVDLERSAVVRPPAQVRCRENLYSVFCRRRVVRHIRIVGDDQFRTAIGGGLVVGIKVLFRPKVFRLVALVREDFKSHLAVFFGCHG